MSGPGNREVRPEVIYDWKTAVEMICGKGVIVIQEATAVTRYNSGALLYSFLFFHQGNRN